MSAVVLIAIGIWTAAFYVLVSGGSLLVILGIYMLHKIVEHGFGLSSGSPYGKYGGVRSVISAASEIPLFVSVAVIAVYTQSLDLSSIMQYQEVNGPLLLIAFPAACAMFLVILSKMPFGPFSIVEAKELVSGYKTEHFGIWRAGLEVCNGLKTFVPACHLPCGIYRAAVAALAYYRDDSSRCAPRFFLCDHADDVPLRFSDHPGNGYRDNACLCCSHSGGAFMIREAILFGGVLYVLITIAQIIDRPSIWSEGIIVAIILAIATAYYLIHDEHRLHTSEIIALWAAVLLFMVYGLLKYGGFL